MDLKNYINGRWVEQEFRKGCSINPATGEELAKVPLSTKNEVDEAVRSAKQAQKEWALVPAPKRAEYLYEIGYKLKEKKEIWLRFLQRKWAK